MAIEFPMIDPVAFAVGPLTVRWYALAYLAGFLLGWRYCLVLASRGAEGVRPDRKDIDDFLTWAILGVILGGRIGYMLFYKPEFYFENPSEIYKVWRGGMSFHGGLIGVTLAMLAFSYHRKIKFLRLCDLVCAVAPIGLFFGRIANFINAELYGRVTSLPIGMVFPESDGQPRHPSQLYEAALEGVVLFIILAVLAHKTRIMERQGMMAGVFLLLYGLFRALIEFVREPDMQIGLFAGVISMGQILCLPMMVCGSFLILFAAKTGRFKSLSTDV